MERRWHAIDAGADADRRDDPAPPNGFGYTVSAMTSPDIQRAETAETKSKGSSPSVAARLVTNRVPSPGDLSDGPVGRSAGFMVRGCGFVCENTATSTLPQHCTHRARAGGGRQALGIQRVTTVAFTTLMTFDSEDSEGHMPTATLSDGLNFDEWGSGRERVEFYRGFVFRKLRSRHLEIPTYIARKELIDLVIEDCGRLGEIVRGTKPIQFRPPTGSVGGRTAFDAYNAEVHPRHLLKYCVSIGTDLRGGLSVQRPGGSIGQRSSRDRVTAQRGESASQVGDAVR